MDVFTHCENILWYMNPYTMCITHGLTPLLPFPQCLKLHQFWYTRDSLRLAAPMGVGGEDGVGGDVESWNIVSHQDDKCKQKISIWLLLHLEINTCCYKFVWSRLDGMQHIPPEHQESEGRQTTCWTTFFSCCLNQLLDRLYVVKAYLDAGRLSCLNFLAPSVLLRNQFKV